MYRLCDSLDIVKRRLGNYKNRHRRARAGVQRAGEQALVVCDDDLAIPGSETNQLIWGRPLTADLLRCRDLISASAEPATDTEICVARKQKLGQCELHPKE